MQFWTPLIAWLNQFNFYKDLKAEVFQILTGLESFFASFCGLLQIFWVFVVCDIL